MRDEGIDVPDNDYESMKDFHKRKGYKIVHDRTWLVHLMLESASTVIDLLHERNWSIVYAEKDASFVCSDNPLGLDWINKPRGFYSPGFGVTNTQVTLPLTHQIALVGVFEDNVPRVGRLRREDVATFNNSAVCRSVRHIYSVNDDFIWRSATGEVSNKEDFFRMLKKGQIEND